MKMRAILGGKMNNNLLNVNNGINNRSSCKLACLVILITLMLNLVILIIPSISALGITPGRTTIDYELGLETAVSFSVLNSEYKQMRVEFNVQGELADFINLSVEKAEFTTLDYSKDFSYKVKFPDSLKNEPGLHTAEIVALEVPNEGGEGTHIGATVAVVSQLYVYVPCPGKCIEADFNVLETKEGAVPLIVSVINRGKLKIDEVKATVEIYSTDGKKVATVETNKNSLDSGKRTELSGSWAGGEQGDYKAKVKVSYDKEVSEFEKQFSVGEQMLGIDRVWVSDFKLGGIAKFRILVENRWNEELKDIFANLIIYDKGYEMANVKSASENLPVSEQKELVAYWDTAGVQEGEYDGKLMIKYGKKSTDKNLLLKVSENSLDISGVGYAVSPKGGKGLSITTIIIAFVIILIVVNLAWFVFFKRAGKFKKPGFFKKEKTAPKTAGKGVIKV